MSKAADDSLVLIEFGYSNKYIFPYADGIAILDRFKNAEQWDGSDYKNPTIKPLDDGPTLSILSRDKYQEMKTLHLLGISKEPPEEKI